MKALNSAQRSSSIITFIAVYLLIMVIPLYLVYMLGKNSKGNSGGGNPSEQKELTQALISIQGYIDEMEQRDSQQANGAGTASLWQKWVTNAENENTNFKNAIDKLEQSRLSGFKNDIRNSVVIYLRRLHLERGTRINLEKNQRGIRSEVSEIQRLKSENEQLKAANMGLQNTVTLKDQLITNAQKSGGNGGGASQTKDESARFEWELLFCDANSQKSQADVLSTCNQLIKRKKLYEAAKLNFQKITTSHVTTYTLKKMARDKMMEIDQLTAKL